MTLMLTRERVEDRVTQYVYPRPITFDEWLETGEHDGPTQLVNGTPVEQPMVQLEHEKLNLWLLTVLGQYVRRAGLGIVLGTRSPVQINEFGGRMPDLFFVRREREHLLTAKATRGAPDLAVEIVSPNDRRADLNATETDYRSIGVAEIVYIDLPRKRVRILRRTEAGYDEISLAIGQPLTLQSLGGLTLEWEWLFSDPRPDEINTVLTLLGSQNG
jgi:Uma2 family endonuclease